MDSDDDIQALFDSLEVDDSDFEFDPKDFRSIYLPGICQQIFGGSRGEARKIIEGGGFKIDGEKFTDLTCVSKDVDGRVIQMGKRKFARVHVN